MPYVATGNRSIYHIFSPSRRLWVVWLVAPDSRSHVTRAGSEAATTWTWRHADDRILVALQHELSVAGSGVPELNTAVLGSGENPVSIWSKSDREDKVLVTFESLDATSALWCIAWVLAAWCDELPHLDGLVQGARNEILSIWCESNGVDGILVSVWTLETLDEVTGGGIPDANALVKRSGCDILGVGRDGDSGDAILDAESEDVLSSLDIPKTDSSVSAARGNGSAIASEVQGVDVLLVASKGDFDGSGSNVPDLGLLADSSEIRS